MRPNENIEKFANYLSTILENPEIKNKVIYLPDDDFRDFYIKEEGPATGILALTRDLQVILVRQFRPGPNEILVELPGGYIGKNQTPKQAAERELMEETGYKGKAKIVAQVYDCAYSTMNRYCVVITDCKKVTKQKGYKCRVNTKESNKKFMNKKYNI